MAEATVRPGTHATWDEALDRECHAHILRICGASVPRERVVCWRALLLDIAPFLEDWALRSAVLRRCGLATEDDAREVLVRVLERLRARDYGNLRSYLARRDLDGDAQDREEALRVERLAALARLREDDDEPAHATPTVERQSRTTPFRAWVLTLLRYAIKDHVRERLGWAVAPGQGTDKRDVNTHAERLDDVSVSGVRPPMTDYLTLSRFLTEVSAFLGTLPPELRQAFEHWLDDLDYEAIAARLVASGALPADGTASPERALLLVRAAKARLRDRFRGDFAVLFPGR